MVMNLFDDGVADEITLQKRRREGELSSSENNNVVASTDTQERFAGGLDMSIDVPDELERMRKTITGLIHEPDWWNLDRAIGVVDDVIDDGSSVIEERIRKEIVRRYDDETGRRLFGRSDGIPPAKAREWEENWVEHATDEVREIVVTDLSNKIFTW